MQSDHLILGIESSCDDTSIALVRNNFLIDCIVVSSAKLHNEFGGVVPELAAREHEKVFLPLVKEILDRTGIYWHEITHIAYTDNPGLAGCLLVGRVFAKTLALVHNKKLIPINHVYGHIFSVCLTEEIKFPMLSLVVSGKTTAIYYVKGFDDIELLDETSDNALGEVYDKVARELGLGYPGGQKIDDLFNEELKVPNLLVHSLNPAQRFSYSGILSAVYRVCRDLNNRDIDNREEYVATIFQKWVINSLMNKLKYWILKKDVKFLAVAGGVASNKYLRKQLKTLNVESVVVDKRFSGDNAAMIALYASFLIK